MITVNNIVDSLKPFTKLFSSIITSSIWNEDDKTRVLWITMLALADAKGHVCASVGGLAHAARLSKEDCQTALGYLLSPDDDSRSPEFEGRRIQVAEGGFIILNYTKYRELGRKIDRTQYLTEKKRESRAKRKCQQTSTDVIKTSTVPSASASSSLSVRKEKSTEKGKPTDLAEVIEFLKDQSMAVEFFDYYQSNGWHVGRNPMRDWRAAARRWQRNQKQTPVLSGFQKPKYVDPNQQKLDDEYEKHRREREARKYGANSATTN